MDKNRLIFSCIYTVIIFYRNYLDCNGFYDFTMMLEILIIFEGCQEMNSIFFKLIHKKKKETFFPDSPEKGEKKPK